MIFQYGIDHLTIEIIDKMIKGQIIGKITNDAMGKVSSCRDHVDKIARSDQAVYGINTGFGPLCDTRISTEDTTCLLYTSPSPRDKRQSRMPSSA